MQQEDSIQPKQKPLNQDSEEGITEDSFAKDKALETVPDESRAETEELPIKLGHNEDSPKEGWRNIISTVLILVAAPLVALLLITFVFQSYEVDGPSMESTLQNHDRLIVDKVPRTAAKLTGHAYIPPRGTVIIFVKRGLFELGSSGGEKQLIKRVIGLPGEHVVVKDGKLTVYNTQNPKGFQPDLDPKYSKAIITTPGDIDIVVGKDEVFVCGDNRTNSLDSRYFGAIPARDIVGKLSYRIFPINKTEAF